VERAREQVSPGEVFYYADEFNISWHPTIRALWSPRGQQVMIPTPKQPTRRYGLGAANWHTGETVVLVRRRKRRREIAELLQALVDKHPHERVYVAWDNSGTHQDAEVEAVLRAAAGRLVLLYLPTYSPWLNPIEMLWRQWRREVTHCELFASLQALLAATKGVLRPLQPTTGRGALHPRRTPRVTPGDVLSRRHPRDRADDDGRRNAHGAVRRGA
jgi:putative transposase